MPDSKYKIIKQTNGKGVVRYELQFEGCAAYGVNGTSVGWGILATAVRHNLVPNGFVLSGKEVGQQDTATSEEHVMSLLKDIVTRHKAKQQELAVTSETVWEDEDG